MFRHNSRARLSSTNSDKIFPCLIIAILGSLFIMCLATAGIGVLLSPLSPFQPTTTFTPTSTPTFTPTATATNAPTLTPTPTTTPIFTPTFTPLATTTNTPTPSPTTPLNACPPNPYYVRLINELNSNLTISLSGPRTYRIVLPVGGTRDTCFVAGTYNAVLSATGYRDTTEPKTFATTTGNPWCWWFYPGASSTTPCTAPTDLRLYSPP